MFKSGIFIRTLAVLMFLVSHKCFSVAIFWESEDILMYQDPKKRLWEVGPTNFIGWYNPITVKEDYFKALDLLMPHRPESPIIIRDGSVLPQIISDWLTNTQSSHEIKNFVLNGLKNLSKNHGKNTKVSQAIADFVFSPERYARTMVIQKKAKSLLKKCCEQKDSSGKKANKNFLVTNWNAESFACALSHKKIRTLMSYFDDRLISGDVHLAKPDPKFIQCALKRFNIAPSEKVIYIDSEMNNIKAIQNLNIPNFHCIYVKDFDFKHLNKELIRLGAFSK